MVKPKPKKAINRKASLASLPDVRAANNAADNPPVPPLLSDITGQRRSDRNCAATSETFGQGDDSDHIRAGFAPSEDEAVRESNQPDENDGNSSSCHKESLLTPIRGSDEVEDTRMGSPSGNGNRTDSSGHESDPHLIALEEEVILAADHLEAIQGKLRMA